MKLEIESQEPVLFTDYFDRYFLTITKARTYLMFKIALHYFRKYEQSLGEQLYCHEITKTHLTDYTSMLTNQNITYHYCYLLRKYVETVHLDFTTMHRARGSPDYHNPEYDFIATDIIFSLTIKRKQNEKGKRSSHSGIIHGLFPELFSEHQETVNLSDIQRSTDVL